MGITSTYRLPKMAVEASIQADAHNMLKKLGRIHPDSLQEE